MSQESNDDGEWVVVNGDEPPSAEWLAVLRLLIKLADADADAAQEPHPG